MNTSRSQRRLAENEVIFREHNVKVLDSLNKVKDKSRLKEPFKFFYCECSSAHCMERIELSPKEYERLHRSERLFIIKPGHDSPSVENIIETNKTYAVVEKFVTLPKPEDSKLNS